MKNFVTLIIVSIMCNTFAQELDITITEPLEYLTSGPVSWLNIQGSKQLFIGGSPDGTGNSGKSLIYNKSESEWETPQDLWISSVTGDIAHINENDMDYVAIISKYGGFKLFKKTSGNPWVEVSITTGTQPATFPIYTGATLVAIDMNNDGYLDIYGTGRNDDNSDAENFVIRNNGDGTFNKISAPPDIPATFFGDVVAYDLNNSGRKDLVIVGVNDNRQKIGFVFRNNGDESFLLVDELNSVALSHIEIGDQNNDGLAEITTTGITGNSDSPRETILFENKGGYNFTRHEMSSTSLGGIEGQIRYADFNNDGLMDAIIAGYNGNEKVTQIQLGSAEFKFNGEKIFLNDTNNERILVSGSSIDLYENYQGVNILMNGNKGNVGPGFDPRAYIINISKPSLAVEEQIKDISRETSVYPNPVKSSAHIVLPEGKTIKNLSIYNMGGQEVLKQKGNITEIDMSVYASGIYLLRLETSDGYRVSKKLIK